MIDDACMQGSIERALVQLATYRTELEERVVDLFDEASRLEDLRRMAGCCAVMADCQGGADVLAQVRTPFVLRLALYGLINVGMACCWPRTAWQAGDQHLEPFVGRDRTESGSELR